MTAHDLAEAIRGLHFLDRQHVPFLSAPQWRRFRDDPVRTFIRFDEPTQERVFAALQDQRAGVARRVAV